MNIDSPESETNSSKSLLVFPDPFLLAVWSEDDRAQILALADKRREKEGVKSPAGKKRIKQPHLIAPYFSPPLFSAKRQKKEEEVGKARKSCLFFLFSLPLFPQSSLQLCPAVTQAVCCPTSSYTCVDLTFLTHVLTSQKGLFLQFSYLSAATFGFSCQREK